MAIDTVAYSYTDNNWKDKLTAYGGQAITYDAIGNPLNDGRRRYEWQAGRQLKKVYVKADLKEGTKPGVDEQTGTVLKIEWSNGNLLEGEVTSTQASATVTRCGVDVTDEYAENTFHWTRDSGNIEVDAVWNAAHAGMKSITFAAVDIDGDVRISCTLTGNGATYGTISVDDDLDTSHTPGELDANDTFEIVNGDLKVTTSRGNAYVLENGILKAAGAKLNGSITAETKLFASQPENIVEFSYNHNGLRTQKKVTKADGTVETTDYTLHGKRIAHLTRGSDKMHFFYDAQNRPVMVECNGNLYSYAHNLQGDIAGILDSTGSLVVEYKYDAWGKPTLVHTLTTEYEALAELNPFRYRAYAFDDETGLFYLRYRYYDSRRNRFLNYDLLVELMGGGIPSTAYAHCGNSPVIFADENGLSFSQVIPPPITGYIPPKGGPRLAPYGNRKGWLDRYGNIWLPDKSRHGGDHWDVQDGKGNYVNVYPNGHRSPGKGRVNLPIPKPSQAPLPKQEPALPPAYDYEEGHAGEGGIDINIDWGAVGAVAIGVVLFLISGGVYGGAYA